MIYQSRDRKGAEYNRAMHRSFTVAALMTRIETTHH
jgi:hypothetical protein